MNRINLYAQGKHLRDDCKLLLQKGVFPCDWFDSFEKLSEKQLPPQEAFHSKLNGCDITDEDYEHAKKVWKHFRMKRFCEYHDLYLKTDVLLLASGHLKTIPGGGKYNLFSVATHELGHALGLYHSNEKYSVLTPFHKHGFSTGNMHEIPVESDKVLILQMYGKPTEGKSVELGAVFNSKKAKVMIRKNVENSQPEKVKIVFTLKPRFFGKGTESTETSGDSVNSDENFEVQFEA